MYRSACVPTFALTVPTCVCVFVGRKGCWYFPHSLWLIFASAMHRQLFLLDWRKYAFSQAKLFFQHLCHKSLFCFQSLFFFVLFSDHCKKWIISFLPSLWGCGTTWGMKRGESNYLHLGLSRKHLCAWQETAGRRTKSCRRSWTDAVATWRTGRRRSGASRSPTRKRYRHPAVKHIIAPDTIWKFGTTCQTSWDEINSS